MSTPFRFLIGQTQIISYTIGTSGSGGTGAVAGNAGQATTLTYSGTTITGNGGSGGNYNSGVAASGGTYSGGDGGANGGTGAGVTGDTGGGGGGAIGTVNGSSAGGSAGNAGANAADVSGFQAAITGAGDYSLTSGGTAGGSGSSPANNINGGAATGFGCGGGSAGWYGGNGGAGLYGGGGGGAAGFSAIQTGGAGGGGAIVLQITAGTTQYVVLTSGTSYSLPSTATSFKAWVIGAGGGGAGSPALDGTSGGGGGAGGVAHKTFSLPEIATVDFEDYYVRADYFRSGNLWFWGQGSWGQRGDNTTVTHRSSPIQTVAYGTNWKQVDIGFGLSSAAIKTDGTLWTMGINNVGQLGDNTVVQKSSPIQTVTFGTNWKQLVCGDSYVAAIKTDGTLWCWGYNVYGQLSDGTVTHRSSPVQTIAGGTNWKQVASGSNHTAAIKTDGTLWMWGYNANGQLGDNTVTQRSSPVQTITFATNWKKVACGNNNTAAIKTDGTLWTWGNNQFGQLGDNTTSSKSSPVQTIAGGTNWKQVSTNNHTAAIKTDGTLWVWGSNSYGQLTVYTEPTPATDGYAGTSPVTVSGSKTNATTFTTSNTTGVSIGMNVYTSTQPVNWTTVSAITPNVSITFTPSSATGTWTGTISLGVGAIKATTIIAGVKNNRSSPIQTIAYGTNWKQVVCTSYSSTAAIKTDGTLWLWGRNTYGGLGDNTTTNRSSPVQTIMYGTNWKEVSAGTYQTAAIQYQDDYQ